MSTNKRARPWLAAACTLPVLALGGCGGDEVAPLPPDAGLTDCASGERFVDGKGCLGAGIQDNGCPAGTLGLEDGTCQPAGIPPELCGEGFEPDGNMGCNAILRAEPCPKGLMAVPGETTCRELAPCGAGTWGDIPVESNTEHVDAAYAGIDSDGSQAKPWKTIQGGVDAAEAGAIVAVAVGSYEEDVDITGKPVRLWGRCPKLVEIVGTGAALAAVVIKKGALGAEVRGVAVRGAAIGLALSGSESVVLDRVWIHDLGGRGLNVEGTLGATSVELTHSLLEGNREVGVFVSGSDARIEATVIRDTQPRASDQQGGWGIAVRDGSFTTERASMTVRASVVEGSRDFGVLVMGSDATIEATVVRDTQPRASNQERGWGICIQNNLTTGGRASATVRASVVEGNHDVGVIVSGSDATIEATVVRGTQPRASDQQFGRGINISGDPNAAGRASATVRASVVEGNHDVGVFVSGSDATIEATAVRDMQPRASDQNGGRGIEIQDSLDTGERSSAIVRASAVEGNREVGVFVSYSDATIEGTAIQGTQPRASDGRFGDGVAIFAAGDLAVSATLTACLVAGSARAGLSNFGASAAFSDTVLSCNGFDLNGEKYVDQPFSFDPQGTNVCGCPEGADVYCGAVSAGLEPPAPLEPLEPLE